MMYCGEAVSHSAVTKSGTNPFLLSLNDQVQPMRGLLREMCAHGSPGHHASVTLKKLKGLFKMRERIRVLPAGQKPSVSDHSDL